MKLSKGERFIDHRGMITFPDGLDSYMEDFLIVSSGEKETIIEDTIGLRKKFPTHTVFTWIWKGWWKEIK